MAKKVKSEEDKKFVAFFIRKIPRVTLNQFKAACAACDETMTAVVKRLMKRYTAQVEGKRKPNSSLLRADLED